MTKRQEVRENLKKIEPAINRINKLVDDIEGNWREYFREDLPEDMYQRHVYTQASSLLEKVRWLILESTSPVKEQGILRKNSGKRYELPSGHEFTSGSSLQYLYTDPQGNWPDEWIQSSVEHNGHDYYLMKAKELPMEGLLVRVKDYRY